MKAFLLTFLLLCVRRESLVDSACVNPPMPVMESTLVNLALKFVRANLPLTLPDINIEVSSGTQFDVKFKMMSPTVKAFDLTKADMFLPQPNILQTEFSGLQFNVFFKWSVDDGNGPHLGNATLLLANTTFHLKTMLATNSFQNIGSDLVIKDLLLTSSNQNFLAPYWAFIKPIVIDTLQREIPNILLELNTDQIHSLVLPIIQALEPIHVPNITITKLGSTASISGLQFYNISFAVATLEKGDADNVLKMALAKLSAVSFLRWSFQAPLLSPVTGTGLTKIWNTDTSISIRFASITPGGGGTGVTVNLENAELAIGDADLILDGGNDTILQFFIEHVKPLFLTTLQANFATIMCALFNGI